MNEDFVGLQNHTIYIVLLISTCGLNASIKSVKFFVIVAVVVLFIDFNGFRVHAWTVVIIVIVVIVVAVDVTVAFLFNGYIANVNDVIVGVVVVTIFSLQFRLYFHEINDNDDDKDDDNCRVK